MAINSETVKRRLENSIKAPAPVQEPADPLYRIQPTASPTGFTTTTATSPTPAAPRNVTTAAPTATYKPGEGSQVNYGEQRYDNGVQASPVIGQADLPKYENVDQFDFNRNYEDTLDTLQRQRADLQQQNDLATQRLQEDYQRRFRDIEQQQKDALALENEKMASRGILRSGLAVREAGAVGNQFGGLLDEQQRALSAALEDRTAQYAAAERGIQEQIGKAQEYLTRQQQMLEEQRARQAASAEAAQRAAYGAGDVAEQKKPTVNLVKDNVGKYFMVDPTSMTRQHVLLRELGGLNDMYNVNQIDSLDEAGNLFGNDYVNNANALARRLGGDLGGKASLDVRLGFKDAGRWGK